jgi:NitT/TauT family transport system permease protein
VSDIAAPRGALASAGSDEDGSLGERLTRRVLSPVVIAPVTVLVVFLALWQTGALHGAFGLPEYNVPYPTTIYENMGDNGPVIWKAVQASLPAALIGYAVGMSLGFVIATILVRVVPSTISTILPTLSATNSMPIVALAPLIASFTGSGLLLKVIVVTVMTTPLMTVYAVRGLTSVDPTALELMRSIEATRGQIYRAVRVPTALPFIFTALKSAVVLALIGTIVSEAVRGFEGLGFVIIQSMGKWDAPRAWLALLVIAGTGIVWYLAVQILERIALPWEEASRRRA